MSLKKLENPKVFWLFGLSGSGKTTLSNLIIEIAQESNIQNLVQLDGDDLRHGINSDLDFTEKDRTENLRRATEIAKIFLVNNMSCICAFITPTNENRIMIEQIIGKENILTIFVDCPISVCEERDVKGLYKRVREGKIKNFTGISAPFDPPLEADLSIKTNEKNLEESKAILRSFLKC